MDAALRLKPIGLGICVLSLLLASDSVAPLRKYTAVERRHWAFVKRAQPDVPKFTAPSERAWVRNPVDAFILARLKKENLRPSPEADRATLGFNQDALSYLHQGRKERLTEVHSTVISEIV